MLIITKQGSLPLRIWMIMMDDDDIYDNNNKININNNNDNNLKTKWVTVNEKCSSTAAKLIKKVKRGRERERELTFAKKDAALRKSLVEKAASACITITVVICCPNLEDSFQWIRGRVAKLHNKEAIKVWN